MNILFESDHQAKVLFMKFEQKSDICSQRDVLTWRSRWTQELKSWHSPYKALIDCQNLYISPVDDAAVRKSLETMLTFLKGFFLRNVIGFGYAEENGHQFLPFQVVKTESEARQKLGLREQGSTRAAGESLRSKIALDNHFRQHVVEMSFKESISVQTVDDLGQISDKLRNNLMQWHSAWSLLIDCSHLQITPQLHEEFRQFEKRFRGFFLKKIVGYSPYSPDSSYPFQTFRSRHRAVASLESEGLFSGEDAQCQSRQIAPEKKI